MGPVRSVNKSYPLIIFELFKFFLTILSLQKDYNNTRSFYVLSTKFINF